MAKKTDTGKSKKEKNLEKAARPGKVTFKTKCKNLREITKLSMLITDSVVLEFDNCGLTVKNVDEKQTQSGTIQLLADGLEDYVCKKEGVNVGIEIEELHEIVMVFKNSADLSCIFDEEIMRATITDGKLTRNISLSDNFKSWGTWRQNELDIKYPRSFDKLTSEDLIIAMKGVEDVDNEVVIFESNKSGFIIMARDGPDEIEVPFVKYKETAGFPDKSVFPVNQVKNIIKKTKGEITLSMGNSLPLEIDWKPEENVWATFMVAPQISGDENE